MYAESRLGRHLLICLRENSGWEIQKWSEGRTPKHAWLLSRLKDLRDRLSSWEQIRPEGLEIYEIRDGSHLGLYALPGGIVLIGGGLRACVDHSEQAELLLIHLLAHMALRHPLQLLLQEYSLHYVQEVSNSPQFRVALPMAFSVLTQVYPEKMESEADSLGFAWGFLNQEKASRRPEILSPCMEDPGEDDQISISLAHPALVHVRKQ
ncbi:MAG: hypothetical protein N2050_11805 [Flavobacteriales bacterium]|nr:hypothetical protein [Flavobacteriales bacterium]MCX7651220.1 hypothetical protein [Flavobacteriales bacterium]MDW8431981.1 hypothetical protein [Flavobacteriales bacterium]